MKAQVLGLNHTSFTVSDLDRAIGVFVGGCGFALLSRAPREPALLERMTAIEGADVEIAFVQGPGHRIELIQYKGPADRGRARHRLCDTGAKRGAEGDIARGSAGARPAQSELASIRVALASLAQEGGAWRVKVEDWGRLAAGGGD